MPDFRVAIKDGTATRYVVTDAETEEEARATALSYFPQGSIVDVGEPVAVTASSQQPKAREHCEGRPVPKPIIDILDIRPGKEEEQINDQREHHPAVEVEGSPGEGGPAVRADRGSGSSPDQGVPRSGLV